MSIKTKIRLKIPFVVEGQADGAYAVTVCAIVVVIVALVWRWPW
jgi:hypothetical protein